MSQDIFVVAEHLRGTLADVTFELLGKGRELADATGGALVAVLLGGDAAALAGGLGIADGVVHVDHPSLAEFNPESASAALVEVVAQRSPRLLLVANTSMGMDLAAAVAVRRDVPLVAYATDVALDGDALVATSQLYGGKIYTESVLDGPSSVVSVLAGSFPAAAGKRDGSPTVDAIAAPADIDTGRIEFVALDEPEGGDVDITAQEALVCVGRGIQSEDNIPLAEALAKALGGAVCSSRPIVDSKWLPKTRQVGKSGVKVAPKIYVTLGVSGAPEHIEGMKDAELIIAINTDENAPIFEYAHYGVTEDLFDVVPPLTEKLES